MNKPLETIDHNGYTIEIYIDNDPENPREWDNLGTMVCFHKRYNLGNKQDLFRNEDYNSWAELENAIRKIEGGIAIILPLYLYEHSGLRISTGSFSCPWDSGQIGFIFVSKVKARKELGKKRLSKKSLKQLEKILEAEVTNYDALLIGDVYGFITIDPSGKEIDSCWGIFGFNETVNYAKELIPKGAKE